MTNTYEMNAHQAQINAARHALPEHLAPGFASPLDINCLSTHLSALYQQSLIGCLASWIGAHACWLANKPYTLDPALLLDRSDPRFLAELLASREALAGARKARSPRAAATIDLLVILCTHAPPSEWTFVQMLLRNLNTVNWNPEGARHVLIETLNAQMTDGGRWLDAHLATVQAHGLGRQSQPASKNRRAVRL
jgi:hypothetical protein